MAIGERIHHFRLLHGFTQKYLGKLLGFNDMQADVRIAQYEKGSRSPKEKYLNALAEIFEVSPHALSVPDIDSYIGLMHTFFALEDIYGLHISKVNGELCISPDKNKGIVSQTISDMFQAWQEQAEKLQSGEISREEYDQWRYTYPQMSAAKSKESVDALRAKQTAQTQVKRNSSANAKKVLPN